MEEFVRRTRSVCPICLKNIPASLIRCGDGCINMEKNCPTHGSFSVPIWKGRMDFETWLLGFQPLADDLGRHCPENCGICREHETGTCCALLEVTPRCNLHCRFCFANGGELQAEPSLNELRTAIAEIAEKCGRPTLILSGGEPTMRDDLPELAAFAKKVGCAYVQLNTNGIRLAEDEDYARRLAEAGLDFVFLQFDGTKDEIFEKLRGKALLEKKLRAVSVCAKLRLGVTLVPTVVKGVNDDDLGDLVRLAVGLAPAVKGIHFQPVSFFGRFPNKPGNEDRYTLDMLMTDLSAQADIPIGSFMPSRCDHPLCGFHADFILPPDGRLRALSSISRSAHKKGSAAENREYVARHWRASPEAAPAKVSFSDEMDFDSFLYYVRNRSFTLSAMAFQDAMNLNIERLHSCTLHVYDRGSIKPFCAKYLSAYDTGS